jgi:hypothetical protein
MNLSTISASEAFDLREFFDDTAVASKSSSFAFAD